MITDRNYTKSISFMDIIIFEILHKVSESFVTCYLIPLIAKTINTTD